jgi:hypothetical protein
VRAVVLSVGLLGLLAGLVAACGGGGRARPAAPAPIANIPGPEPVLADEAFCSDPIAGTWRTRVFRAEVGKWDEVTLTIIRVGLTELRGQIVVESWDGDEADDEPATCPDGSLAVSRVVQSASGWIHGGELDFAGSDPERTAFPCGFESPGVYNPDHFTGALDEGPALVTTNDDGGTDDGRPHIFTRRACGPP